MTNFEGEPAQESAPFNLEDIIWNPNQTVVDETTDEPILVTEAMIARGQNVIKLLLAAGGVPIEFADNEYATNLPALYELKDIEIEFLPHREFYTLSANLGNVNRTLPKDTKTISQDLEAAINEAARLLSEKPEE